MADIAELLKVMQEQMQLQREQMRQQEERHRQQEVSNEERHKQQLALMQQQMEDTRKAGGTMVSQHQTPPFLAFDSTAELWKDYLLRFETFVNANSVPDDKKALVFLTNQTSGTYKLITNYASQQDVPTTANAMKFSDITGFMSSHYDYTIEYRSTKQHGNADALSRLPVGPDLSFDGEEGDNDVDTVCTIRVINSQLQPHSRNQLKDATNRDPVLSEVKRYVRERWPQKIDSPDVQEFKKYAASLSVTDDCLINGNRVVIPEAMQPQILDILHLEHFGMQRMKQLARSAVYWPHIDSQIEDTCRGCVSCAEHQNKPPKPANHPWMMPEKPWSRIHVDHAINFMGNNWLIVTDAYSKYPCIHQTSSTSTQATTTLLEEDFAHFGYPHTIVSDNATTFSSAEFQLWCHQRGIKHLTGAPYHPATNGAAERMVQSFKQSLKKSKLPLRPALQEFLMQYRRTPLNTGFSPSQLLNGRQLRTKIDALLPSPAHIAQEHQACEATKSQQKEQTAVEHVRTAYDVGTPCYALYCAGWERALLFLAMRMMIHLNRIYRQR